MARRVFSGIWSDPEKTSFMNSKVMEIVLSNIEMCLNMFPIIFRPDFFADRLNNRHFQIGALKLGFVKKTVMLYSHVHRWSRGAVPNLLPLHGLVTFFFAERDMRFG